MATNLVRKQIYIQKRQDVLLKRLSKARGVSEAEIIRQAIERAVAIEPEMPFRDTHSAMEDFSRLALAKRQQAANAEPFQWDREEIYRERENRWIRENDDE